MSRDKIVELHQDICKHVRGFFGLGLEGSPKKYTSILRKSQLNTKEMLSEYGEVAKHEDREIELMKKKQLDSYEDEKAS